MKERPILFSGAMVRAILDGRKTQTRRIVKHPVYCNGFHFDGHEILCHNDYLPPSAMLMDVKRGNWSYTTSNLEGWETECPYGQPGDRLWVRETWAQPAALDPGPTVYRADYPACVPAGFKNVPPASGITWKPSIHMPRAACRLVLEVASVRVERLNDCSEADARAEGVTIEDRHKSGYCVGADRPPSIRAYRDLWDEINGAGAWNTNPWVWVVEFRRT